MITMSLIERNIEKIKEDAVKAKVKLYELEDMLSNKENFSKVWFTLLDMGIDNIDIYKGIILDYLGVDITEIHVDCNILWFYWGELKIFLPYGNKGVLSKEQFLKYENKFIVKIKFPYNIREYLGAKVDFEQYYKNEDYIFAKQYLELLKSNASLRKRIKLRYKDVFYLRAIYLYITKGRIRDKKENRDKKYYETYIKNFEDKVNEWKEMYNKKIEDGKEEYNRFKREIEPEINKIFESEFCNIEYIKKD